jgi:hypothetical protein
MKTLMKGLLACALLGMFVAPAGAEKSARYDYSKAKKRHAYGAPRHRERVERSDYYEHLADRLPIGSSRWFAQMEREGRFRRGN